MALVGTVVVFSLHGSVLILLKRLRASEKADGVMGWREVRTAQSEAKKEEWGKVLKNTKYFNQVGFF